MFVDVTIPEYNIDITQLETAYSDKTKAVMIAHSLGNPFDLQSVKDFVIVIIFGWLKITVMHWVQNIPSMVKRERQEL